MKTKQLFRPNVRFGQITMLSLLAAAMHLAWMDSRQARAQETTPGERGPQMVAVPRSYRVMYVDRNNAVRLRNSKQPLTVQEATESLLREGGTVNDIRQAAEAMRKRVQEINSDIRGYRVAEKRAQEHQIAVQRKVRLNEVYRRVPATSDADRTERTEQLDGQYRRSSQTIHLSPEEEEQSLGHKPINHFVGPSGARLVVPAHRYAAVNYDPKLVKEGVAKAEARLEKVRAEIERLVAMKEQLLPCIRQLDGESRYRRSLQDSPASAKTAAGEDSHDACGERCRTHAIGRIAGR